MSSPTQKSNLLSVSVNHVLLGLIINAVESTSVARIRLVTPIGPELFIYIHSHIHKQHTQTHNVRTYTKMVSLCARQRDESTCLEFVKYNTNRFPKTRNPKSNELSLDYTSRIDPYPKLYHNTASNTLYTNQMSAKIHHSAE